MENFRENHIAIIDECCDTMLEIERALFTKQYNLSSKHFGILSVQSISMLYSIWEGFIRQSFQLYIEYINKQDVKIDEYIDSLVIYDMEKTFKQFKQYPQNPYKKREFFDNLNIFYHDNLYALPIIVDTESNVNFDCLNKLLKQFGLNIFHERWEFEIKNLKEVLSDFIRYRNCVAHGNDISNNEKVTQEVFCRYRKVLSNLMYEIHLKMIEGIVNETYRKHG